jgi:predicted metalloprotease
MKWRGRRRSGNVIDRRGKAGGIALGGGGLVFLLVAMGLVWCLGGNPLSLLGLVGGGGLPGGGGAVGGGGGQAITAQSDDTAQFVAVVLADTEDVWHRLFRERGSTYREPSLVLFTGNTRSGCGFASAAIGPFYCPADETIYIDLGFFQQLRDRLGAPGDFAQAYVIAHEVGHHVQHITGVLDQAQAAKRGRSEADANAVQVEVELMADYLAGVWTHHAQRAKQMLEQGDLDEALNAASAIGDDTLQRKAQGYVVPDSFTHGTSAQRRAAFRRGYETGRWPADR